jgi:predicted nucleic acid-binding protein
MTVLPPSLRERRVFIDSSAYLALLDEKDEHHSEAAGTLIRLAEVRYCAFTTNTILAETYSLVLSVLGRTQALRFLREARESHTVVVRVRAQDEERAARILNQYDDKNFSLVDAISFAVMERLAIRLAFTFDHHFAQYGFQVADPSAP